MSKSKNSKKDSKKTISDKKIEDQKVVNSKTAKKTEKTEQSQVSYAPLVENTPQVVMSFDGKDKGTMHARAMYMIAQYLIVNKGLDKFNTSLANATVKQYTGVDFHALFVVSDAGSSPVHQGLHRISKSETKGEIKPTKDGKILDTFARGARQLLTKDRLVGCKTPDGFYHKTVGVKYVKQDPREFKAVLSTLLTSTLSPAKRELLKSQQGV